MGTLFKNKNGAIHSTRHLFNPHKMSGLKQVLFQEFHCILLFEQMVFFNILDFKIATWTPTDAQVKWRLKHFTLTMIILFSCIDHSIPFPLRQDRLHACLQIICPKSG